jgi:hypothetical protein
MSLNLIERVVTEDYIIYSILDNSENYKNEYIDIGLYFKISIKDLCSNFKLLELLNLSTYWYCRHYEIKIFHNIRKMTDKEMVIRFKRYLQLKMNNSPFISDEEQLFIFIASKDLALEILPLIKNLL